MRDLPAAVLLTVGVALAFLGIVYLGEDVRHFREIKEQCEKQGFIQNKTVRITCAVEKTK